MLNYASYQKVI